MNSTAHLTGALLRTYNAVHQDPIASAPGWPEVYALMRHLGEIEREPGGEMKVTRNGGFMFLPSPDGRNVVAAAEIRALRHFIERTSRSPAHVREDGANWLVIVDDCEACRPAGLAPAAGIRFGAIKAAEPPPVRNIRVGVQEERLGEISHFAPWVDR